MKIKKSKGTIKFGDVFLHDGCYYLLTDNGANEANSSGGFLYEEGSYLAVNLETGNLEVFGSEYDFTVVSSHLVVE